MGTVLVTGGSRGIGAACVKVFSEAGHKVYFFYQKNAEAARNISEETGAVAVKCDVADKAAVASVFQTLPDFDILVNNAGVAGFSLFQDCSEEEWSRILSVNLDGVYRCTKAVLPAMISRKKGCIINLSSMWGQVGASCEVAYSAAKAGVIGLTKALAKEVGPCGIRVNCVAPGVIATEMNSALTAQALSSLEEETPLGRMGTPEEVAKTVLWLASEQAAFFTGQVFAPNGGYVI